LRACRSVFYNRGSNHKKSQKRVDSLEEKLHRAKQHRFLFLPSQHINKPIQHLKYHKRLVLRDEEHYKFYIPPNPLKFQAVIAPVITLDPSLHLCSGNASTSNLDTHSPATNIQPILPKDENTWHDKLGIWIPNDLLPYVTDEPVYTSNRQAKIKGKQWEPGSIFWLNGIKKRKQAHELAVRQQKDREASDAARLLHEAELSSRAKLWVPLPTV
ncbi:unnamed protein product, partial [Rhizophagus irregularis]